MVILDPVFPGDLLADDLDKADGPTHLAVVLDRSSQSFRNEIYDQYKANRPEPPEDLVPQFPLIRDATRAFSLPCIEEPDVEADDMIASYARAAQDKGWNVTIVSSDKDLMQLVGEKDGAKIDMLDTMKSARIYIEEVEEKFGVPPEKVGDVLALMGDSVDNIPGIFGVGPKTASKLIAEHGDLAAALDSAEGMKKSKLKERLIEHRGDAELSRVLVTLKEDCELPVALDDMKLDGVPNGPLAAFLEKHGFTSLLKRLEAGSGSPTRANDLNPAKQDTKGAQASSDGNRQPLPDMPEVDRTAYECVQSRERLEHWIERARAAQQGVDLTELPAGVRSKYERALVALTDRAQAGNWSREKYEGELADILSRAKGEMNGRGSEASTGEITRSRRDYERALAALDERAKAGEWTRERYESERTELAERLQIRDSNDGEDSSNSSQEQEVGDGPARTQAHILGPDPYKQ
jgi:DNA polymerase-1